MCPILLNLPHIFHERAAVRTAIIKTAHTSPSPPIKQAQTQIVSQTTNHNYRHPDSQTAAANRKRFLVNQLATRCAWRLCSGLAGSLKPNNNLVGRICVSISANLLLNCKNESVSEVIMSCLVTSCWFRDQLLVCWGLLAGACETLTHCFIVIMVIHNNNNNNNNNNKMVIRIKQKQHHTYPSFYCNMNHIFIQTIKSCSGHYHNVCSMISQNTV